VILSKLPDSQPDCAMIILSKDSMIRTAHNLRWELVLVVAILLNASNSEPLV